MTNYIFPLITIPYVTRIFGPEIYGLLSFATYYVAYFILIINYGFDLSASREIAQNRDNKVEVEKIFNKVIFSMLLLFIISTVIFLSIVYSVPKIREYKELYFIAFFSAALNVLFPSWFFQGIEKLSITAKFNFLVKLIFTILVFILIKSKNDYLLYFFNMIIGQVIVSIIVIFIIIKKFKLRIAFPNMKEIFITLKNGWKVFISTTIINLYTPTNFVILGFLGTNHDVGIYTAADKMAVIILSLILFPMSQSLYPNIGNEFAKSKESGLTKHRKSFFVVISLVTISSIFLYLFSEYLITFFYGKHFKEAIVTLKILSFLPLMMGLSNIFGIQGLLNLKEDKLFLIILTVGAIIGLLLNFLLIPLYKFNGAAISRLLSEFVVAILMFVFFINKAQVKRNYFKILYGRT